MGEIMEISGLGQMGQGTGYTSYLSAKVTRGGAPYSGPVTFTDDETNKVTTAQAKGGLVTVSFSTPKTSSITVSIPGMEDTKTAHGLTVSSTTEAQDPVNVVLLDLPGTSIAPTLSDSTIKWLIAAGVGGLIVWYLWRRYQSPIMDGLGWLGIVKPCGPKQIRRGRTKRSQKWCLFDRMGKKVLGRHSSRRKAIRQERAIQVKKHR